ncbi:MAG TPA: ATP synthase F0 subunit B [Candidatus Paceibacterota bacterium]|nr:ATP synthase F0 subunit B [Candidatus Paceibacterota bacterium]
MEEILHTFGIDWRLLAINAINFGLVLLALWYFLYSPITRVLEERRQKVVQGVEDANKAAAVRKDIENNRSAKLAAAGKEADEIISHARESALRVERELVAKGETAAAHLIAEAESEARELKTQAIEQSKQEVAKMVVLGIEKMRTK